MINKDSLQNVNYPKFRCTNSIHQISMIENLQLKNKKGDSSSKYHLGNHTETKKKCETWITYMLLK